jgi:hypothetical protein
MSLNTCYSCGEILTKELESSEHIIPNAIGGMLKSNKLLCKSCNNTFGNQSDAELAKQLEFFCNRLQVKRDRGEIQPVKNLKTKDGKGYSILGDGRVKMDKPFFKEEELGEQLHLSFICNNMKEARQFMKGLKRKYPGFDLEEELAKLKVGETYLNEPIGKSITIGGEEAFRSLIKTAVNFYLFHGGDRKNVLIPINAIKGIGNSDICNHFHSKLKIYNHTEGEVIHLLHMVGNRKERALFCYIEYFSSLGFIILLNAEYTGQNISHTYTFDVLNGVEIEKEVSLELPRDGLLTLENQREHLEIISQKLNRIIKIGAKIHRDLEGHRILMKSLGSMVKEFPNQEKFTNEMLDYFIDDFAVRLTKFMNRV